MFRKRLKNVIVLPFTSYCFNFRSFTASKENSKTFPKVRKTSSSFSGLVFSFIFSLISQIRSLSQFCSSATRINAVVGQHNGSVGQLYASVGRLYLSVGRLYASVGQLYLSVGQLYASVGHLVAYFKQNFLISPHYTYSPIAESSDLLHIPHNLLPT